jgi:cell division protein FtsZ
MIESGLNGPIFVAADSDKGHLENCPTEIRIQVGKKTLKGKSCDGQAEKGRMAVEENIAEIMSTLADSDMVFLVGGLGGGTASGGLPVVAEALSKQDRPPVLVSLVTQPFGHEKKCLLLAKKVTGELFRHGHSLVSISNSRLPKLDPSITLWEALNTIYDNFCRAVSCVTDLIERPGVKAIDFDDVSKVMSKRGAAYVGFGQASGDMRAHKAFKEAISNPLMPDLPLARAKGVLVNISADSEIAQQEIQTASKLLYENAGPDTEIFIGVSEDDTIQKDSMLRLTVVATGIDKPEWAFSE